MMRPKGSAQERTAPEIQARTLHLVAANVAGLMTDAIDGADKHAVGNGVGALDGEPGFVLRRSPLILFRRMPADGGGIEEDVGTLQGSQTRTLGIPLIPADQGADRALFQIEAAEAEVAGGEVILFVIEGIVGDVHLAVEAADFAVAADDDRGVVIEAGGAPLKKGDDNSGFQLAGEGAEARRTGSGNGLGEIEQSGVLALAEILGAEELGKADDLGAAAGGLAHVGDRSLQVFVRLGRTAHLYEAYLKFVGRDFGHGPPAHWESTH